MNNIIILILKKNLTWPCLLASIFIAGCFAQLAELLLLLDEAAILALQHLCQKFASVMTLLATQAVMLLMPVRDFSWEIFKIPLKYRKLHIKIEHWILFISFLLNSVDAW